MALTWSDSTDDARAALRVIVSDPVHEPDALRSAQVMSSLLSDLLPDRPRAVGLLVAAVQARLPAALRGHAERGMDAAAAVRPTASAFAARTAFTAAACNWGAGETRDHPGTGRNG